MDDPVAMLLAGFGVSEPPALEGMSDVLLAALQERALVVFDEVRDGPVADLESLGRLAALVDAIQAEVSDRPRREFDAHIDELLVWLGSGSDPNSPRAFDIALHALADGAHRVVVPWIAALRDAPGVVPLAAHQNAVEMVRWVAGRLADEAIAMTSFADEMQSAARLQFKEFLDAPGP